MDDRLSYKWLYSCRRSSKKSMLECDPSITPPSYVVRESREEVWKEGSVARGIADGEMASAGLWLSGAGIFVTLTNLVPSDSLTRDGHVWAPLRFYSMSATMSLLKAYLDASEFLISPRNFIPTVSLHAKFLRSRLTYTKANKVA